MADVVREYLACGIAHPRAHPTGYLLSRVVLLPWQLKAVTSWWHGNRLVANVMQEEICC